MFGLSSLFGGGASASSSAGLNSSGSDTGNTRGEWVINMAGSGTSYQGASAAGGLSPLVLIGGFVLAVLWLKRK